jgi:hypothetical protein
MIRLNFRVELSYLVTFFTKSACIYLIYHFVT